MIQSIEKYEDIKDLEALRQMYDETKKRYYVLFETKIKKHNLVWYLDFKYEIENLDKRINKMFPEFFALYESMQGNKKNSIDIYLDMLVNTIQLMEKYENLKIDWKQ